MKKIAIACAIALSSPAFAGSTATELVQACQSLKRQEERNTCLVEAVKAVSGSTQQAAAPVGPSVSPKDAARVRAQQVIEASQAIQSIAASGTSLLQYQSFVQQFSILLGQYRAAVQTPDEKEASVLLSDALNAYSDAGAYWQADNEFFSHSDARITYRWAQPTGLTGTRYILDRYSVPISKADLWGIQKGAPLAEALSTIWEYAQNKTDAAKNALAGIESPAKAARDARVNAAGPPAKLAEMIGTPLVWTVKDDYAGGAYADHDLTAPRDSEPAAGKSVPIYASYGRWLRTTPLGKPPKWFRSDDLNAATDIH
ncbi:hypothetical protein [Paraburkholderia aspalathi]|uniref:hypothetical protein n=1 Tax=Paraburkholderia aspalathi TaxID=1324617 RepID=UPI001B225653|nr:hypothetical protein [Paraburkholderia aspalathi]CAE6846717.1 hypothetical protein R20943_07371 [Paraburkholderia aspalathi]